jgi:membrane-associated phospholipid phosphatase
MVRLGALADHGAIWMALGALAAIIDRRHRPQWFLAGALGPVTILLNWPLKRVIGRRRPDLDLERLGVAPSEHSFPSSHAASSFASATAMSGLAPSRAWLFFGLAAVISTGRPYLGMHYPSDVLGGALYGTIVGLLARFLLRRRLRGHGP